MNALSDNQLAAYAGAAARLLGCEKEDLLTFRWSDEEQQFIVLAPSGQKHRFDVDLLEAALAPPAPAETDKLLGRLHDQAAGPPTPAPELPGPPAPRPPRRRKVKK